MSIFMSGSVRILTSMVLVSLLVFTTIPVSAADLPASNGSLGTVSGTGSVQLRGSSISQEETLMSGDHVRTFSRSYAKVILVNGNKVELSSDTEFVVSSSKKDVRQDITLGLMSGNVTFTAALHPFTITVGKYEVVPKAGASAEVAFIGSEAAGIHVLEGRVTVRNTVDKTSVVVSSGSERIVNLKEATKNNGPIAQFASASPGALPQGGNAQQAARPAGQGLSKTAWVVMIGTVVLAAATIGILVARGEELPGEANSRLAQQLAKQGAPTQ